MRVAIAGRRTAPLTCLRASLVVCTAMLVLPAPAMAQTAETEQPPAEVVGALQPPAQPMTSWQRRQWMAEQILSTKSVAGNLAIASWQTAVDSPREWQGSAGFAKRVLTVEADTAMSKGLEASLGSLWGEDPRPTRSRRTSFAGRLGHAMTTTVLAPRPDGHLAPAWARYAGIAGSNMVQNAWLPSRLTTPEETSRRMAAALLGRLATNLWEEFGPDLRRFAREQLVHRPAPRRPRPVNPPTHR